MQKCLSDLSCLVMYGSVLSVYICGWNISLTLGAHARGLRYLSCVCVCVCVCVSVYPSVPTLAASASVETSKQGYSRVSLRLFLD